VPNFVSLQRQTQRSMHALRTLLNSIIDYAGLFPPASLSMTDAVTNYARYLQSPEHWALARFIVPVSRLEEFSTAVHSLPPSLRTHAWKLSALIGNEVQAELEMIDAFNARFSCAPCPLLIDTIELKATAAEAIEAFSLPASLAVFVEIPIASNPEALIVAIKRKGYRAKVRTGGVTADAFPSPHELARFIFLCAKHQTPFKATAGLHHPIRALYRLTYAPDSPCGLMFGFLNVFLAAALAFLGMDESTLAELLSETNLKAISFQHDSIQWRTHSISLSSLAEVRAHFALAFGSCSFEEPIADLKNHHLLEDET